MIPNLFAIHSKVHCRSRKIAQLKFDAQSAAPFLGIGDVFSN